jgi:hypothetical protein
MLYKINILQFDKALQLVLEHLRQSTFIVTVDLILIEAEIIDEIRPIWKFIFLVQSYHTFTEPYNFYAVDMPSRKVLPVSSNSSTSDILTELGE